jgi:hypothetical protein
MICCDYTALREGICGYEEEMSGVYEHFVERE